MARLIIDIDRDAHDDDAFMVEIEDTEAMGKCDNCNKPLKGATILGRFHSRKELMIYLKAKINELAG